MNIELIITLLGAIGGLELIKFLYNKIVNRKNESIKDNAEALEAKTHSTKSLIDNLINTNTQLAERYSDVQAKLFDAQDKLFGFDGTVTAIKNALDDHIKWDESKLKTFDEIKLKVQGVTILQMISSNSDPDDIDKEYIDYESKGGNSGVKTEYIKWKEKRNERI